MGTSLISPTPKTEGMGTCPPAMEMLNLVKCSEKLAKYSVTPSSFYFCIPYYASNCPANTLSHSKNYQKEISIKFMHLYNSQRHGWEKGMYISRERVQANSFSVLNNFKGLCYLNNFLA